MVSNGLAMSLKRYTQFLQPLCCHNLSIILSLLMQRYFLTWRTTMFKHAKIAVTAAICTVALLACGDDDKVSSPAGTNYTFSSSKDLANTPCSKKIEGKTAYFEPEEATLACEYSVEYEEWVWINQESLEPGSTTSSAGGKSSSSGKANSSNSNAKSSSSKTDKASSSSKKSTGPSSSSKEELPEFDSTAVKLIEPCIVDSVDNCEYETFTDERDGRTYKAVKIGTQTWMAEDLAFKYKSATVRTECASETKECGSDSVVYSWSAAMDSVGLFSDEGLYCGDSSKCYHPLQVRGACPVGWHLPNKNEWLTLATATSSKTWKRLNEYGFAFKYNVYRQNSSKANYYWTSTEEYLSNGDTYANSFYFEKESEGATLRLNGTSWHNYLYAIRCVKDVETHKSDYKPTYIIDERNGEFYRTVKIGKQHWMAQNLNLDYEDRKDGACLYNPWPVLASFNCVLDNKRFAYGYYFTWSAAVDSLSKYSSDGKGCGHIADCKFDKPIRGVCPKGWHLPDSTEWVELLNFVKKNNGGEGSATSLKSTVYWKNDSLSNPPSDRYRLSIIPSGWLRLTYGTSGTSGGASFWTSNRHSPYSAIYVKIDSQKEANFSFIEDSYMLSVRCIED